MGQIRFSHGLFDEYSSSSSSKRHSGEGFTYKRLSTVDLFQTFFCPYQSCTCFNSENIGQCKIFLFLIFFYRVYRARLILQYHIMGKNSSNQLVGLRLSPQVLFVLSYFVGFERLFIEDWPRVNLSIVTLTNV